MAVNSRRTGARSLARGIFAVCWIVLGGFSGLYLFTLFTDPAALGGQAFQVSAMSGGAAPAGGAPAASAEAPAPAAPMQAKQNPLDAAEVASLKQSLQGVSQQLAQLDARLKPIERFVGPVAALPPAASVTTSPPAPQAVPEPEVAAPPPPEPEPVAEAAEEVVEEVVVAETEIETPPEPEPEPQAAAAPPPAAEPPAEPAAPPVAVTDEPEMDEPATADAAPQAPADIAALDPVTLPPAANDGSTRYGIEIGSVKSRDDLRPLWRELLTKHAALVAGLQPRRVKAPDNTWRLIAGPFANAADAEGACTLFRKAERSCAATVFAGDSL